ncbi:hypothetical protein PUNSTDRAFT_136836 [Punctularia strigosozonata HHB-11173 SS5]|uniref:uncharacterized protein n=1 Tax=Punctularia strigosozonata (strain HHB-11173) TaxID=741275 RepID=UPI00044186AA|nr:uncharacterized protein PUNSTDRAFT_136836 [Punctularia strigosozonata HHB-11173 SS5]EIN06042.1 hypothetical protein PUNSTDRAFT_136836 [Punctularia strigosozonata HHB-11173 SS5]
MGTCHRHLREPQSAPKKQSTSRVRCTFPGCTRTVSRHQDLDRHLMTHNPGAHLRMCPAVGCGHSTLQKSNLDHHINTAHKRDVIYHCLVPGCPALALDPSTHFRHSTTRHKFKPFDLYRAMGRILMHPAKEAQKRGLTASYVRQPATWAEVRAAQVAFLRPKSKGTPSLIPCIWNTDDIRAQDVPVRAAGKKSAQPVSNAAVERNKLHHMMSPSFDEESLASLTLCDYDEDDAKHASSGFSCFGDSSDSDSEMSASFEVETYQHSTPTSSSRISGAAADVPKVTLPSFNAFRAMVESDLPPPQSLVPRMPADDWRKPRRFDSYQPCHVIPQFCHTYQRPEVPVVPAEISRARQYIPPPPPPWVKVEGFGRPFRR